ncbi:MULTISPECIES: ATP-binding protein [unclassified Meiothermus]|uniref:sensor histidine kinase n=1 Tax=unclassified Meiothermus TaxID=370471 RepID=UPI000D7CAB17|nr:MULTISPECIES: ATP-binding protein [unclassified Meiothermus]PZA05675.1 PAS domain-containing sensor histidine kinase [Meiothermus sp. Pnk-1]RYM27938.1 PAS domain-containing protein [Meiothermus sp. PNK-Is4]
MDALSTKQSKALEAAWEQAREGLVLFSEGRVSYLNPAAAAMLGVERERVTGRSLLLALRDHRLEVLCHLGGEATVEVRGHTLWAKADPAGCLLLWDKSEEKARQEALEEASRVLAHEFRTPVAGMLSLLDALLEGLPPHEAEEALEMIRHEAQRLSRLVEDLPLNRLPGQERTFPLGELRPRLERFLAPQMAERGSWITWEVAHTVRANPDAVYQALLNLLENALKYGPPGEIQVVSEEVLPQAGAGLSLRLEVRDHGHPLPDYEGLFRAGSRGVHAASVRGSGLGLALVRRLARSWGGEAYGRTWEAGQSRGNAFGLTFPGVRTETEGTAQPRQGGLVPG